MSVFGVYSKYYDLLYKDKDYTGEAEYIHSLAQKYNPGATSLIDLGCGTGRHAFLLAEKGYQVSGVDLSEEMLEVAKVKYAHPKIAFYQADATKVRLNKKVDVATALFHVVSYQTTNENLTGIFQTAQEHLNDGGIFIFDCWYGPCVLSEKPVVRVKRLEDEKIKLIRIAEPFVRYNENIVDVNYTIWIKDKEANLLEELQETHSMRYLFLPEIEFYAKQNEFTIKAAFEWMTDEKIGRDTWGSCFVCRKNN
jgi:SAM-dependent methyltransferase